MARVAKRRLQKEEEEKNSNATALKPRRRGLFEGRERREIEMEDDEDDDDDLEPKTPTKRPRTTRQPERPESAHDIYTVPDDDVISEAAAAATSKAPTEEALPVKRKRGRPPKKRINEDGLATVAEVPEAPEMQTPSGRRKTTTFATPTKAVTTPRRAVMDTPMRRSLADRSARRKSTRALIDRIVEGDEDEDEEELEDRIFGVEEEEEAGGGQGEGGEEGEDRQDEGENKENEHEKGTKEEKDQQAPEVLEPVTPRRRGRPPKKRDDAVTPSVSPVKRRGPGRPRKDEAIATQKRLATPPRDLPAHEHYFFQNNKAGAAKTSNNTLAALRLLTPEEYFARQMGGQGQDKTVTASHEAEVRFLEALHAQSFGQWAFELAQGFGVCLYGYGAKRRVLRAFAKALWGRERAGASAGKIVMVDGWAGGGGAGGPSASAAAAALREILGAVAAAIADDTTETPGPLPAAVPAAERALLARLDAGGADAPPVTLLIDGIDAPVLRRASAQATLAYVAAHPRVHLLCAADTAGFVLLWDGAARAALNLVFHDATTFRPRHQADTVDEVHALLGRRVRRVGGKDGAAFVLRSLPENARNLFQLLVGEALAAGGGPMTRHHEDDDDDDDDGDEHAFGDDESAGLEYRMLYNKAVEEFICSSEMAFRTLLKEFHDHQMVVSRKDAFGTELLSLPFRRDELEALLEDLLS